MELSEEKLAKSWPWPNRQGSRPTPDCVLAIDSHSIAAVYENETENNVQILIQGNPSFWVEEAGTLQVGETEVPVRVSNIVRVEVEADEEDNFAPETPIFRVGLARLGRSEGPLLPEPPPRQGSRESGVFFTLSPEKFGFSRSGVIGLMMILIPLALAAGTWACVHWSGVNPTPTKPHDTQGEQITSQPDGLESSAEAAPTAEKSLTAEILRLPGAEPFVNEALARRLELTQPQRGSCQRLNDATQAALADLEKSWESTGRLEIARRRSVLLEAARREALELLTEPQRRQWDELAR